MKRIIIPFVLIVILAFQGVAMELLPPSIKFAKVYLTPHWILIFLILVAGFVYPQKPMIPIIYAAVFGLMTDIVYTGVLGVYMFVIAMSLRSEEHTSELQSRFDLVCRLLLEKKKKLST